MTSNISKTTFLVKLPTHTVSCWNKLWLKPQEITLKFLRVSSEEQSIDLPFIGGGPRDNTSKPIGRQNVCDAFLLKIRIVKFASSQRLPELRVGTARMHEETVFPLPH